MRRVAGTWRALRSSCRDVYAHKRSASAVLVLMPDRVEAGIVALASDQLHGAGYLARKALGLLVLVGPDGRVELGRRLASLRPEMPSIAAAVNEALEEGDVRRVIRRADAERRRVARAAMRTLRRKRVATISNSSLVARALVYAGPRSVQVVISGPKDEGHLLVSDLLAAGLSAGAIPMSQLDAEVAVVGCDAVFDDGSFINRRGTRKLVDRLPTLVLADRWKRIGGPPPTWWPAPERFELIAGDRVRAPA
jgi:translation initiation factor 2B subunit (eIF-2B alpha/beta/delta family)